MDADVQGCGTHQDRHDAPGDDGRAERPGKVGVGDGFSLEITLHQGVVHLDRRLHQGLLCGAAASAMSAGTSPSVNFPLPSVT